MKARTGTARSWFHLGLLCTATALPFFLSSCATTRQPMAIDPIGPAPTVGSYGKEGLLQVFTATSEVNEGGIPYYPHTSYRIYEPGGKFLKYVRNANGRTDQSAEGVTLPVGKYYIIAMSEGYGVVKVPVQIKGSQVTGVYLDRTIMRGSKPPTSDQVVAFPNGHVIGWRAKPE